MLTEAYREKNIEHVLEIALKLCKEMGIESVNNTIIAKSSNLSQKSIQRYFDGKTDMIFKISQKILERNHREMMEVFEKKDFNSMSGLEQFSCFCQVHNRYVLEKYKDMVFLQSADIYCRYSGVEQDKYWHYFRTSKHLEKVISSTLNKGIDDGSVRKDVLTPTYVRTIAVLCAGFVDRLATDIDCGIMSVEEAVALSEGWISHTAAHLSKS